MNKKFEINIDQIHIANTKDKISATIEELLRLNDMIPAQTDEEILETTQKQLKDGDYANKPSRGEVEKVTELQFGERKDEKQPIQEVKLQTTKQDKGGHKKEETDGDSLVRGHKKGLVPKIWLEVYEKEDDRKDSGELKKNLKK